MIDEMKNAGGLVLTGQGFTLNEVDLVTSSGGVPETVVWEGDIEISDWTNYDALGEQSLFLDAGLEEGMEVRIYVSGTAEAWKIKVYDGHWGELDIAEIGGGGEFSNENSSLDKGYLSFKVNADMATRLTTIDTWGSFIIVHGEGGLHVTKITII